MVRMGLPDVIWERIVPLLPAERGRRGRRPKPHRGIVEAIAWVLRTGAPWRDLPAEAGPWKTVYNRFRRWSVAGIWSGVLAQLAACASRADGCVLLDGSVVRAHQHAAGAPSGDDEALGRSRGGLSTKIHAATDATCRPLRIIVTGGQRHDVAAAPELVCGHDGATVIADKAYDSDSLIQLIEKELHGVAVIPSRSNRRQPREIDAEAYKKRNAVERFFCWIKRYRRIATRYEKRASSYLGMLFLAGALCWCRFL